MTIIRNCDITKLTGRSIEQYAQGHIRKTSHGIYMSVSSLGVLGGPGDMQVDPHMTLTEARKALGVVITSPIKLTRPRDDAAYLACYQNRNSGKGGKSKAA